MRLLGPICLVCFAPAVFAAESLDLNKLIARRCGAPGYQIDSGCTIELEDGTFEIEKTIALGGCTAPSVRNSVVIRGQGAGLMTTQPRFATAGTTLRWKGPAGGAMFDLCGASFFALRDVTLDAQGAGVGIRISGDNQASAISHFVGLQDVVVDGAGIGVLVTGRNRNDQIDFVTLERVSLYNVDVGYLQDSQQSVAGRLETVEVGARRKGFEIRNGSLNCENCYVGALPGRGDDFIAFHLTRLPATQGKPWDMHHQVSIARSHMELASGRFVVEDAGAPFPLLLTGNSYSLQCATRGCEMSVLDSRNLGPVVMIAEAIQSGGPTLPKARICHRGEGKLETLGVFKKPEVASLEWSCKPAAPAPPAPDS